MKKQCMRKSCKELRIKPCMDPRVIGLRLMPGDHWVPVDIVNPLQHETINTHNCPIYVLANGDYLVARSEKKK